MANAKYKDDDQDTPPPDDQSKVPPADESSVPGPGDRPPGDQVAANEYGPQPIPPPPVAPNFFPPNRPPPAAQPPPVLTNFFRQNLSQPRLPPSPAPTRPGQPPPPQQPPAPQRLPQPSGPPNPFGLPAFRRASRQLYIPASANREHNLWGAAPRFPMLPMMWQVPSIFQALGSQFAMWGSGSPTMPGSMQYLGGAVNGASGAYLEGYMRGQEIWARQKLLQMKIDSDKLLLQTQRELEVYGKIFDLYGDGKHPEELERAISQAANELQDQPTIEALRNLGPDGVVNLKRHLDAKYRDLHASNAALTKELEKQQTEETEQRRWGGERGAQRAPETDVLGRPVTPQTTDVMGRPRQPAPPLTAQATGDQQAGSEAQQMVGTEPVGQAALEMFRGGSDPTGMDKNKKDEAEALRARLQTRLDQIRDSGLRGQPLMDALEKFDPATAAQLREIIANRRQVPQGTGAGGRTHPYYDTMTQLAHDVDPTWMSQQFKAKGELLDSFYSGTGKNAVRMVAASRLAQASAKFRQAVRELDPTENIPEGAWNKFVETFQGDPRYTNLMTAWRQVVIASTTLSRGATPTNQEERGLLEAAPISGTKAQLLGAMQVDMADARIQYEIAKEAWTKSLGQPLEGEHGMPNYSKDVDEALDALENRMDPNTGRITEGDVPHMLQWKRISHNPDIARLQSILKDPKMANDPRRAAAEARLQELLKTEEEPQ